MLNRLDDYPIHQTPEPVAHPATGDRNAYDRYFFNGYSREGDLFFAVALGVYPNRRVMDASFSVVRGGVQHALHASRLAPAERTETRVGPIAVEVVAPMRALGVRIASNEYGIEGDLVFRARSAPLEEPRFVQRAGSRIAMDSTRFTQFGSWEGTLAVDGARVELRHGDVLGCRDRSWGVRPVGERESGPPGPEPQFFWLWAPLNFDDVCTHFGVNEDAEGRTWSAQGCVATVVAEPNDVTVADPQGVETMAAVTHRVTWQSGTRRASRAQITLTPRTGEPRSIELEPILTFQMLGLGYLHPDWGHGLWKGSEALGYERWALADLDPLDPRHLHVQQLCRASMRGREGIGVLEQLVIGRHVPSGFKELFDGAP